MPLIDDRLAVGSIIFEKVNTTHPPKDKYYIVVGITGDKIALGTVYINTDINPNIFKTAQLRSYHLPILASDYPFLKYDSYIDCSSIQERQFADVQKCILSNNPQYGYHSTIADGKLAEVIHTLDTAHTISPIVKKKFSIRK